MDEVFWINGNPGVKLAIVMRPYGGEWLEGDMQRLRRAGLETVVSLLERDEAAYLGLAEEQAAALGAGMDFLSYPIPDVHVPPDAADFSDFVATLEKRLRAGEAIGVHCRGCIGRSTVTAACTLIHLGWNPKDALAAVEATRGCPVPDTIEQRDWILNYKAPATSQ